ncbi:hypothetical protein [Deinococcus hopiensis]|uniref:Uncharacterized protein n=1 Tax=Deinococcus hopiensis KR-140 TaxID=695939 RepID=A0A1W1UHH9_9DEIO|nr:hypothetical protein [Deinococcus hopiensis]SMB80271.1 hypothetical protein SAMN00790413_05469 [Deinococcus hopiensis KR-140]
MRELQAGERMGVAALGAGAAARLVLRVRGGAVAGDLPGDARVWAVLVGPGARVLDSGPLPSYREGGGGLATGEAGVPGVVLRPELLYGETHRIGVVLTWMGAAGPLALDVRVDGGLVARAALPAPKLNVSPAAGGRAMLLATVYRRGAEARLWIHAEEVRGVAALETLFELPDGALRPDLAFSPGPEVARGAEAPAPPPPPAPGPPVPPATTPLGRLREAWAVLTGAGREEFPAAPPAPAVPREGPGEEVLPSRTAQVLAELGARLAALREVQDEEERVRRAQGLLLSPEDARRRARLSALEETHARVREEAVALARRGRQLRQVGGADAGNAPEILAVENAIEQTVRALSRALDTEARRLVDGPLQESQRRLSSEARFLEDLDGEG